MVESSSTCFDLAVAGYLVSEGRNDLIFEPNEEIVISQVRIVNTVLTGREKFLSN